MIKGLVPFPLTPTDADGKVDAAGMEGVLAGRFAFPHTIGILGSTGIYAYLSRAERTRAVQIARDILSDKRLLVGVGALRTDDACRMADDAAKAGADALLLAPVSYTPLTEDEIFRHFEAVASVGKPLVIYNNPSTTHVTFSCALLERLAEIPNIVAVKMPLAADPAAEIATLRPTGLSIGYSGDWGCCDALLAGADAWYSVIGGLFSDSASLLTGSAQNGNRAQAMQIDERFGAFWALFREFGSLRVVYAIANLRGWTEAQPPRPILPLTGRDRARVESALSSFLR